MTAPRMPVRCDGCGQTDDHPKMHYAAQVFHHDCIPAFVMDDLTSESYYRIDGGQAVLVQRVPLPDEAISPATKRLLKTRDKAQSGTRGLKLLDWINSQPPPKDAEVDTSTDEEN